jgi:hypothetical protein
MNDRIASALASCCRISSSGASFQTGSLTLISYAVDSMTTRPLASLNHSR